MESKKVISETPINIGMKCFYFKRENSFKIPELNTLQV